MRLYMVGDDQLVVDILEAMRLADRAILETTYGGRTCDKPPLGYDLGVSVRLQQILDPADLEAPRLGWINLHFGKLPEYRGVRPLAFALLNGDPSFTVTWHKMTPVLDAGDIVWESSSVIRENDDAPALYYRARAMAVASFREMAALGLEEVLAKARPQTGGARYYSRKDWESAMREALRYEKAMAWR